MIRGVLELDVLERPTTVIARAQRVFDIDVFGIWANNYVQLWFFRKDCGAVQLGSVNEGNGEYLDSATETLANSKLLVVVS